MKRGLSNPLGLSSRPWHADRCTMHDGNSWRGYEHVGLIKCLLRNEHVHGYLPRPRRGNPLPFSCPRISTRQIFRVRMRFFCTVLVTMYLERQDDVVCLRSLLNVWSLQILHFIFFSGRANSRSFLRRI
ncbi:hypothetical protein MPTK2_8g01150 [Marchantia polymorpha subsp. ruderalis]